ncbi:conserved Plasmodium protein, unknown function [Plasmodium berghei]|uniref:Uncharacterized protein n=2 Tax=Plasmodium berghei TaxID=5821 RepID=A0A509AIR4_PLABA|nr:conserved Plasmodium protein, unknown function [Plasmodium berghei ANKA]SCM22351.1 conserved Plasmodium protein, unknown function [Plasmodium berghei]SCN25394.1 conserved Plasmodium protein, unknown function [Plasmodium berghei]SCO62123.1 conserved Plasmodium protein, unknown function [Plasmodium berghei]VUC55798.1 conserved Plasmodium protein, unknown function [Plasmodium berghei ANKA]|eukprot:XP_034421608.1 conserved Plasmodium protein, unknown function [Plasmodium berghei ANKA]
MENFANSSNINIGDVSSQIRNILGQNIEEGNKNNNKNENIQYNENCTYTTSLENEYLVKQNTVKNIPYISKENIPEPNQNIQKEVTIKDTSDDIRTPYTTNCFLSKENMSKYFSNNDNEFNTNKNLQDAVNRRKQIREMILSNNSLNLSLSSHNFEQIDIKEHISEQNFTNIHKQMLDQYNSTNKGNNSRNGENGVRRDYNGKNDCTINNQNNIYGKINNNNYNSNLHNNNNNVNTGNIGIPLHKLVSNDNGNENDIDYKTFLTLDSNQTIFKAKPLKVPDISFLHSNSKSYSGNSFNNPYESERQIEYNAESNSNNDNNYNFTRNKILYEKLDGLSFYCDDDDNKIISTSRRNYQSSTLQKLTGIFNYNNNSIVDKSALDRSMSHFDLRREKQNDIVKNYIKINKVRNGNIRNEDNGTNNIFNNCIHKDENRKMHVHGENDLNNADMHRNAFDHDYNKNYDTMYNIRRSTNIIDNLVHNRLVYNNNHIFNNNENINILNKISNPNSVYPIDFRSNNTHDGICNNIGKYNRYNNFNYRTIDNKYVYDKNNFMHENENYVNLSYIKNIEKFKELLINIATDNLKEYVKCLQNINEKNLKQYKDDIMQVSNYNINHFINEAFKVSNPVKNIKESILNNSDTFSSLHKSTNESDDLSTTTHDDNNSSNSDLINLTESRRDKNSCIHISCNDVHSSANDCKNNSKYCSKKNVKYANELAYVSTNKSRKCRKLKNRLNLSLVNRSKTNKSSKNCDNNHTKNVRSKDPNSKNIQSNTQEKNTHNLEIVGNLNDIKEGRKKKKSYNIPLNKQKNNVGNDCHNSYYANSCKNCCKKAQVNNFSPQKGKKKNSCNSNKKYVLHNSKNSQKYNFSFNTDSEDYNDNNEYLYISQNDSDKNNYEELNTKENLTTSSDKNACKCNDTHKDENKKEYNSKNYSDIDAYISNEDIKENKNDKFHKEYNHKDKYDVNKEPKHLHMHSHTRQASNKQMSNASLMKRSNSEKIFGTQKDSNIDNKTENTIHNKYINCNVNKSLDYCENINSNDKLSRIKNSNENNINCSLKRESNYNFDGILNKDHENISNSNDDALNFQANSKDNKKHLKNEMDISNSTQDDNYNYKQSIDINPNTIENIRDLIKNNKTRVENLYVNESSQDNLCINKNINELKYRMKENNKSVPLNKFNNTSNLDNEHPYSINSYNDETENRNIIQCSLDSFNDEFYNSVTIPTPAESILSKSSLCSSHNENTLKKNNFDCVDSQSANGETIDHSFPIEKENSFIKECKMEMKVHRNDLLNDNSSSNNGDNSNNIYINKKEFLGKYTYSEFSLNTKQNISNSIATNNINNVDRKFIDKNTNLIVDEVYKELFQQKKNIFPEMNNSSEIISNTSHMNNLMVNGLGNNTNWYNNDNSSYNNELGEKNKNIIRKIINTLEIKEMKTKTKQGVFEITPNGEVMFTFLGRSEIMKYKNVQNKKYVNIDISKPRKLLFIIDVGGVNIKIKDILLNIILDFYNIFEEELPQAHKVRYTYAYDVVEAFKKHTPKISLTKKWLGIYNLMSNGNAPDFIATLKSNMFIDKIEIKNNYVSFILKDKNTINLHIDDLNEVTTQFTKSMMNNKNGNIHQPNMPQSNINLIGIEGQNEHVKNIMMNLQVLLKRAGISIDIIIQNWCNTLQAYSHCLGLLTKGNSQYALKLKKTLSNISGNPEFHKRNVYFSIFPIFVDE